MWLAQPSWSAQVGDVERCIDWTPNDHLRRHSSSITPSLIQEYLALSLEAENYM
jgi:hypothetical protein